MTDAELPNPLQTVLETVLDRLDRQDATLAEIQGAMRTDATDRSELRALLDESATDRVAIHERMEAMTQERARLLQEAKVYQDAMETRVKAVEARDAVTEIQQAIRVQLVIHRWFTQHKIGVRLAAVAAAIGALVLDNVVRAAFHALGWL